MAYGHPRASLLLQVPSRGRWNRFGLAAATGDVHVCNLVDCFGAVAGLVAIGTPYFPRLVLFWGIT